MPNSRDGLTSSKGGHPRTRCSLAIAGATLMLHAAIGENAAIAQRPSPQSPPLIARDNDRAGTRENLPPGIADLPTITANLEVIHRRSQLIVTRQNVVRSAVADPSIIEVVQYSPNEISVIGYAMGSTTLTLWFENDPQPMIYLVKVIRDPSFEERARIDYGKLEKKLALLFPNSKVYLIPLSGKIIVKGQARNSEEATWILNIIRSEVINQAGSLGGPQPTGSGDTGANVAGGTGYGGFGYGGNGLNSTNLAATNVINLLEIPGDFQVMLRVRIVELNRTRLRTLGVDWSALIAGGRDALAQTFAGTPSTLSGVIENGQVAFAINALETNGVAKILNEPTLTVLSGHPATVLSGGEFAVPTIVGINGVGGQQTYFRGFGATLVVIPVVMDKDLIRMNIRPEFSQIDPTTTSQGGIPGLTTRRVQTTVQLREGQTIVLAGLISHQSQNQISGIPGLQSIPLIGPLIFRAKQANQDETELLITVSPEIVRPMDADEVPPYPGFEITQPNNRMLYLQGYLQGPTDTSVNQLAPYGHNSGVGVPIGYGQFNPAPSSPLYSPVPTAAYGAGFSPAGTGRYATPSGPPNYGPVPEGIMPPGGVLPPNGVLPGGPNGNIPPKGTSPSSQPIPSGPTRSVDNSTNSNADASQSQAPPERTRWFPRIFRTSNP